MYNETIIYYSKNHPNKCVIDDFDVSHWEDNRTCGDDLKVYIKIDGDKIKNWSFEGDTALITTACGSAFGESIMDMQLEDVLKTDYDYIEKLVECPISERRKKASTLALLTTRNAIHKYLKDGIVDSFDDVIS